MPRALLVYPEFPPSFWSYKYALEIVGRKATLPPLGLLTVAGLFPAEYELRLVDMNVKPLPEECLAWADMVLISSMVVQRDSFAEVVQRCNQRKIPVIAGGPYASSIDEMAGVDHVLVGEVEDFFGRFLAEYEAGRAPRISRSESDGHGGYTRPALTAAPLPRYDLISPTDYLDMSVQFSRGCPFNCDFCDITRMYGRQPRTKSAAQILGELEHLYRWGWRGSVFFVDDNFIGNASAALDMLPQVSAWQTEHGYPFELYTEASVNLAERPELMAAMAEAGFVMVFVGIETPNAGTLDGINKRQNTKKGSTDYLLWAVRRMQQHGLEVTAGFILGLDGDDAGIFDLQIDFIQKAGIASAMVGLLWAIKGTELHDRLRAEGRLTEETASGNNVAAALNFVPRLDRAVLLAGYKRVLTSLYDPSLRNYFRRCYTMIRTLQPHRHSSSNGMTREELRAMLRSFRKQILSRQGPAYLAFLVKVLLHRPRMFGAAVSLAVAGYHFEKVTRQQLLVDDFRERLAAERAHLPELAGRPGVPVQLNRRVAALTKRYLAIEDEYRPALREAWCAFQGEIALLTAQAG